MSSPRRSKRLNSNLKPSVKTMPESSTFSEPSDWKSVLEAKLADQSALLENKMLNLFKEHLGELGSYRQRISDLENKVCTLEDQIESLLARDMKNNLVFEGLKLEPAVEDSETLISNFVGEIKKNLDVTILPQDIMSIFPVGKITPERPRKLMVKLCKHVDKRNIMIQFIKRRPGFYINEQLSARMNNIFYRSRQLKKSNPNKIKSVYTRDCIVIVKLMSGETIKVLNENDLHLLYEKIKA